MMTLPTSRTLARRGAALLMALASLAACDGNPAGSGGDGGPEETPVAAVILAPADVTLRSGDQWVFSPRVVDAAGEALPGRTVAWTTSNQNIARVESTGQVIAVNPGVAVIRATAGGKTGQAIVTVTPKVVRIALASEVLDLKVGETLVMIASARDASGAVIYGLPSTFQSLDPAVATIDADGLVRGVSAGETAVRVTIGGVTAQSRVIVRSAGPVVEGVRVTPLTLQLKPGDEWSYAAQALGAGGAPVDGGAVAWSSSNPAVATVSATGRVTAVSAGSALIRATVAGVTGEGSLTVVAPQDPPADLVYDLAQVAGQALPLAVFERQEEGGAVTVEVLGGYFKPEAFDLGGQAHYEQAVFLRITRGGVWLRSETYFDQGTARRTDDGIVATSSERAGFTFTVRSGGTRTLVTTQTLGGEGAAKEYTFRQP